VAAADDAAQQDNPVEQASDGEVSDSVVAVSNEEGRLNFEFSGDCWLQVKDGAGKVLYSGILSATDTLDLSGVLPLELRIGNPPAVKLRYNDVPVVIEPSARRLTFGT